jgi:DNA-binding transcriptional MocR family regulator
VIRPPPAPPAPRSTPLYAELADSVQALVEQGTLRPGHRVPSVRVMARQRDVSVATVVQAYTVLENRGLLEARPQSGFYVRPRPLTAAPEPRIARPVSRPSFVGINDLTADVLEVALNGDFVPFGSGCPHPSLFPVKRLARLLGSVARRDPELIGQPGMNWGHEPLTREIARRHLQAGVPIGHEGIVVTSGATEALNLCLRAVTRPGDTVAIETPAYFGFLEIIQALNLRVLEIPTCPREGMCLDALAEALGRNTVRVVMVMPNFHNPLGALMPDGKKRRLLELAAAHDLTVIEDDLYGDTHFDEVRPKPLKAWDRDGRVMLCSSFGKTLAPGFHVGWTAPGRHLETVRRLKFVNTMGTPRILQKTLAEFLRDGGYDHHLRGLRRAYREHLHAFLLGMQRHFPAGTRYSRPRGGNFIWVEFSAGVDTLRLRREALRHRINTAPGPIFSAVKDRYRHCLRMSCSQPWSEAMDAALATLGGLVKQQL